MDAGPSLKSAADGRLAREASTRVGLFDSGWGGLSVAIAARAAAAGRDMVYVGDHAWSPYGERDAATIRARALILAGELVRRGCGVVVVACNTASSLVVVEVRGAFPGIPVVGVVPAVKPAAARTASGRIAVLATPATVAGPSLARLVADHAPGIVVDAIAAPGLVGFVERGETEGPAVEAALRTLLGRSLAAGADAVVLGCTHYPFLRPALARVCGPGVALIDSGEAIARRLAEVAPLPSTAGAPGGLALYTTGDPALVGRVAWRLLGERRPVRQVVAADGAVARSLRPTT